MKYPKTIGGSKSEKIYFSPIIDRFFKLIIPFVFIFGYMFIVPYMILPYDLFLQFGGLLLLYFVPPAGRETIIPFSVGLGVDWVLTAVSIVMVDLACCMFMLWNFELVCRLPLLGPWIESVMRHGHNFLKCHPLIERLCTIGLVIFVFIPFQGTGAANGSIIGKIAGIKPIRIFFAVLAGSTIGSFFIAYSSFALQEYLDVNLWYLVVVILIVIVAVSLISYAINYRKQRDN